MPRRYHHCTVSVIAGPNHRPPWPTAQAFITNFGTAMHGVQCRSARHFPPQYTGMRQRFRDAISASAAIRITGIAGFRHDPTRQGHYRTL